MKSRYLLLVPLIILAAFLIPVVLLRNEIVTGNSPGGAREKAPLAPAGRSLVPSEADRPDRPPAYTAATPSPGRIGNIFMGREISQVMGHPGIGWLERSEREKEEAPSKAIRLLELQPDAVIADIGAGSGYYSFRIAPLVREGKVISVDIQPEMLDFLETEAERLGMGNVVPHLGAIDGVGLPAGTLDAALIVDAYHEFSHPAEMLRSILKALRPGGKVFLLEYRAEDPEVPILALHKMTVAQATMEFEALGFEFLESKPGLPWQHLLVFGKPDATDPGRKSGR